MNKPVVLITGALTGIGRATAVAFAEIGARLVFPAAVPLRVRPSKLNSSGSGRKASLSKPTYVTMTKSAA